MNQAKLAALAAALVVPASSFADVAFSTFGPGDSYRTGNGYTVAGPNSIVGSRTIGFQFIPTVTGLLQSVELAMFRIAGTGNAQVSIRRDDNDTIGDIITTWNFGTIPTNESIITLPNLLPGISLTAGEKYWFTVGAPGAEFHSWNFNDQLIFLPFASSTDGSTTWNYAGNQLGAAFRVNVVPEPATMLVLGAGLAAMAARRRRRA